MEVYNIVSENEIIVTDITFIKLKLQQITNDLIFDVNKNLNIL